MESAALRNTSAAISTISARLAIVAIVSYQILLIALIFLRPDLAPSWHTISEWAIGPYGGAMSGAFLISAMSYAALFVMLKSQLHGSLGRIGLGILLICVLWLAPAIRISYVLAVGRDLRLAGDHVQPQSLY